MKHVSKPGTLGKSEYIWNPKSECTLVEQIKIGCYIKEPTSKRPLKVLSKNTDGFFVDMTNRKPIYITNEQVVNLGFIIVPKLHIDILMRENKNPVIAKMLLMEPIGLSKTIIQASGYDPNDPRPMMKVLVAKIFTINQWNRWIKRFKIVQIPKKKQTNVIKNPPKVKKLPKNKVKQIIAARQLVEDAINQKHAGDIPKGKIKTISNFIVKPQDFIIKVQNFNCLSKGHTLESVQAEIVIRSHNGKGITSKLIPAGYCQQCKHYYILSSIYEEYYFLMKDALCDFVNEQHLSKFLDERSIREKYLDFKDYKNESVLKKCGYSVSQKDDLRDYERLQILESIIKDYKILSKQEVMTFINWLIRQHQSNPLQIHAIQKWKADLLAIAGIENKDVERVHVKLIKYT